MFMLARLSQGRAKGREGEGRKGEIGKRRERSGVYETTRERGRQILVSFFYVYLCQVGLDGLRWSSVLF